MADAGSSFFPTFDFGAATAEFFAWWNQLVQGGDRPGQTDVRAVGIDPATRKIVSPQYEKSLGAQGLDVNDPTAVSKYADQLEAAGKAKYEAGFKKNFQELGGLSVLPFSPAVGGDKENPLVKIVEPLSALTTTEKIVLVVIIVAVVLLLVMN